MPEPCSGSRRSCSGAEPRVAAHDQASPQGPSLGAVQRRTSPSGISQKTAPPTPPRPARSARPPQAGRREVRRPPLPRSLLEDRSSVSQVLDAPRPASERHPVPATASAGRHRPSAAVGSPPSAAADAGAGPLQQFDPHPLRTVRVDHFQRPDRRGIVQRREVATAAAGADKLTSPHGPRRRET